MAPLICGNTERANDVVMASCGDHDDGVEADLGCSMKLPGEGGMAEVTKQGGTTKLPGKRGTPNLPGVGGRAVPNGEEDGISVGDWSQAFLQEV